MTPKRQPALDRIDIKILALLQRNGRSTIQKLAETVGLSPRPCLERVRRLENAGIIAGYQAVVTLELLSRPLTIFAEIVLEKQTHRSRFELRLTGIEQIVACSEMRREFAYLAPFVWAGPPEYEGRAPILN